MRVLMIGPYPRTSDRIDGGVAAAMTYLSGALAAQPGIDLMGVRITFGAPGLAGEAGFTWPIADLPLGRGSLSTLYIRQKRRFARISRQFKPDIVHAQGADVAGLLAAGSGVPNVVTIHGLLAECAKFQTDFVTRLRARLVAGLSERRTVRRASHLISISPYVQQYYARDIGGRVYEIPNAVSPAFFTVERAPEDGRLLYAGRIANGKGLVELMEAVSRAGHLVTKLVLAGATPDAAYESMLRRSAIELGIGPKVVFAGLLNERSLLREFELASTLVLPSFQETAPMVVQQAMAAGLSIIASKVGGIPFQIQHEVNGLLFQAGDTDQLAKLLERLGKEPSVARLLGENAKKDAEARYRAESVARNTVEVYRDILSVAQPR